MAGVSEWLLCGCGQAQKTQALLQIEDSEARQPSKSSRKAVRSRLQRFQASLTPSTHIPHIHSRTHKTPYSCCCERAPYHKCCRARWPGRRVNSPSPRPPNPHQHSEMEQLPRLPGLPRPRRRPALSTFAGHGHGGCLAGRSKGTRSRRVHRGKSSLAFRFQVRWAGEGGRERGRSVRRKGRKGRIVRGGKEEYGRHSMR